MTRLLAMTLLLVAVAGLPRAAAAPPGPAAPPLALPPIGGLPPAADGGFHMEPRPVVDDVFGDTADYRKAIDRFLALADTMQHTRDQFARAVQVALAQVTPRQGAKPAAKARKCPEAEVARSYGRALQLGERYLRTGRELTRRHEQVREFDRLGETVGLTPDYRHKVKRVFADYAALLVDYREMKVAFHDQLNDELKFAGCDLDRLAARGGIEPAAADGKDEAWPASVASAGDAPADPGETAPPAAEPAPAAAPRPAPLPAPSPDRSGILFYIDNTRCTGATRVELDGRPLGEVPAATRTAYQATPGPHELCLLPIERSTSQPRRCGEPGTIRRSYLHEGWTIALRCE